MPTEQQAMSALDEIERVIRSTSTGTSRGIAAAGSDICAEYRQIRPRLDVALPMIDRIPLYGGKIATAIRFLMQMVDGQCMPPTGE